MQHKLGALVACSLFAVCFGAVGVGASWVLGATVYDGLRAKEWVRVKADIVKYNHPEVTYRYVFAGQAHTGDRLGSSAIGGTDNVDSWHDEMDAMLVAALDANRPITVFVNPDNPVESMVDREIRWRLLVFTLPFAFGFGGVGLGAIYVACRVFVPVRPSKASPEEGAGALGTLWAVTFFWNVISFPIAILLLPQIIAEREWLGLFVLVFPAIGVLILWGAIQGTWNVLRHGSVTPTGAAVAAAKPGPRMVESSQSFRSEP